MNLIELGNREYELEHDIHALEMELGIVKSKIATYSTEIILIPLEERNYKQCCLCATNISVKYRGTDGCFYCNKCAVKVMG